MNLRYLRQIQCEKLARKYTERNKLEINLCKFGILVLSFKQEFKYIDS